MPNRVLPFSLSAFVLCLAVAACGSKGTGTGSISGTIGGASFNLKDSIYTLDPNADVYEIVLASSSNLCAQAATATSAVAPANLMIIGLGTGTKTVPTLGAYTAVNSFGASYPASNIAIVVVQENGTQSTVTSGQVNITKAPSFATDSLGLSLDLKFTDGSHVTGTVTAGYCGALLTASAKASVSATH